jgi:hypothetical protein
MSLESIVIAGAVLMGAFGVWWARHRAYQQGWEAAHQVMFKRLSVPVACQVCGSVYARPLTWEQRGACSANRAEADLVPLVSVPHAVEQVDLRKPGG